MTRVSLACQLKQRPAAFRLGRQSTLVKASQAWSRLVKVQKIKIIFINPVEVECAV
jgi:hypothetical protein